MTASGGAGLDAEPYWVGPVMEFAFPCGCNGNGTITDDQTGLTWEKLSDDGSIHEYADNYTWCAAFTKITTLNSANFAGHNDWRFIDYR